MLEKKVSAIARRLKISEPTVAMVLYLYLSDCMQEALLDGKSSTIFGMLKLNEKDRPIIEVDKEGLISLLNKTDIKLVQRIVEYGPSDSVIYPGCSTNE